jgi:hypothetical protein
MNLFYIDHNPIRACLFHVDRHVVKMPLELAQMLSTAHHVIDGAEARSGIYKPAYANHPCTVWVRENRSNYAFAALMLVGLLDEYRHRYGRTHGTSRVWTLLSDPPRNLAPGPLTEPPQAMPEEYKHPDPLTAYRNYYRLGKAHLHQWTKRSAPVWVKNL